MCAWIRDTASPSRCLTWGRVMEVVEEKEEEWEEKEWEEVEEEDEVEEEERSGETDDQETNCVQATDGHPQSIKHIQSY